MSSRIKIESLLLTIGILALTVGVSARAWAQVAGATVSGTVTDTSGAVIPQAQVAVKNVSTGISSVVTVNSDGFYIVPNLLPGTYEISVSSPGFSAEVHSGITLTVGAQQVLNFTLQVGQITQKVDVTSSAPTVQLASSDISSIVSSNTVVELPLNGRDWTQLATLQPAVNAVPTQAANAAINGRGSHGYGTQLTISGTRPQFNNYRLDGISIVDYAGSAPGSALGVALGVDAISEFSVLTANYSAEYGRTSGGIVNAITRSGSNLIHGDAYWFLRDEGLDARNFFDTARAPFHRNQFGGSAGGPIQKEKTFFFGDYEGFREDLGSATVDLVPSPDARNGIIHNPDGTTTTIGAPGSPLQNSAGTVGVDPLVKPFMGFYPLPNAGLAGLGNTGYFDTSIDSISRENFGTVRIDRKFSEKNSVYGTYFFDKALTNVPDSLDNVLVGNQTTRQMISLEESHIFSPAFVNSVRGGFSRIFASVDLSLTELNKLDADLSLGAFPGLPAPAVSVTGLTDFTGGGVGSYTGDLIAWNSWQAYDDAFITKGFHSLKFGFAFERIENNFIVPSDATGAFTFDSLTAFLTNQPKKFVGAVPGTTTPRGVRQSVIGGYLQDDWRWRPNLTLNLGLRYEVVTVPTEVQNKLTNLRTFTAPYPGHLGSPFFNNPTLHDFEPRLGFSWDPFHDGKTAVRGAFGIFDVLPLNYEFSNGEAHSTPFNERLTIKNPGPGTFPGGAAQLGSIDPSKLQTASIQFNPPRNYMMTWNLNVQRELTPSTSVMVGYIGNHGVHMQNRADDVNLVLPTATPAGFLWPDPVGSGTIIDPAVSDIRGTYWGGDSAYDALEAQVSKRMSHGLQVQGSFTWGRNIDTGSASTIGNPFTNSISSPFWFCNSCRRGLSDFNIGRTLVVNYLWDVPTPRNLGSLGAHLLGGWEVGGIITAEDGVPITPIIAGDPLGLNSADTFAYPNRLTGTGCASLINHGNPNNYIKLNCFGLPQSSPAIAAQCAAFVGTGTAQNPEFPSSCSNLLGNAGRNIIIGPGIATWDFSLFKNNHIKLISENFNIQFRAEFFNILNRANFATPVDNSTLFDQNGDLVGGAGAVDKTSTTAREIQLALKLIW